MWRRLFRILLFLLLGPVVLAGTILLVEPRLDLGPFRNAIEQRLSSATGREIRVAGDMHVDLGRHMRISATQVSASNPRWAQAPTLFTVARGALGVDLLALFRGVVHVESVELSDLTANLAVSGSGERSWASEVGDKSAAPVPEARRRWTFVVEEVLVERVAIRYSDPAARQPSTLHIDHFHQKNDAGVLKMDALGQINGVSWRANGDIGSLQTLLAGHDIAVDLQVHLEETVFTLQGRFADLQSLRGIDLNATLHGPALTALSKVLGRTDVVAGDIDLALHVADQNSGLAWQANGHVGSLRVETHGVMEKPPAFGNMRFTVAFHGEDLSALAWLFGMDALPVQPYRLEGEVIHDESGLDLRGIRASIGTATLALAGQLPMFPQTDKANVRLDLLAPDPAHILGLFGAGPKVSGPLKASIGLTGQDDGKASIDLVADLGRNRCTITGTLGSHPDYLATELNFAIAGSSLATLTDLAGLRGVPETGYQVTGSLAVSRDRGLLVQLGESHLGRLGVNAGGSLGKLPGLRGTDLALTLSGASLHDVASEWTNIELPALPFQLQAQVTGELSNPLVSELNASLGKVRLETRGRLGMPPQFAGTKLDLKVNAPGLSGLIPVTGIYAPSDTAFSAQARLETQPGRLEFQQLIIHWADAEISGNGEVLLKGDHRGARFSLHARGNRLSDLGQVKGVQLPNDAFDITAGLRQKKGGFEVHDLVAKVGEGEVSGGAVIVAGTPPHLDLVLNTRRFALHELLADAVSQRDATPGESPPPESLPGRLIPDDVLPLDWLTALHGQVRITSESLDYPDPVFSGKVLIRDLSVNAKMDEEGLSVETFRLAGDRGELTGNGVLRRSGTGASADWTLRATELRFGILAKGRGLEQLPAHDLSMQLRTHGHTYAQLAAALDGRVLLNGGRGATVNAGVDKAFSSFLAELVTSVNPFHKKEETTSVECTALAVDLQNGMVQIDPGFVIRTDKIDISAVGTIDLKTEKIDVSFRNAPRRGIGLSAAGLVNRYIKVGGTLHKPRIVLDPQGALVQGTAAVATGGLSVIGIGLLDRLSTAANPCAQVIAQAQRKGTSKPEPKNPLRILERALEGHQSAPADVRARSAPPSVLDMER